jgi:polyferredoxin
MDTIGYPKGLIRYTTENAVSGKPSRIIRPRIIFYAFLLAVITGITAYIILQRVPLGLDVIRDRNQLYRDVGTMIENVYTLKIINMDEQAHTYRLYVKGIKGLILVDKDPIEVDAGTVLDRPIRLRAYEDNLQERSNHIVFKLTALDDDTLTVTEDARFLGPAP